MKNFARLALLSPLISSGAMAATTRYDLDEQVSFQAVTWLKDRVVASGTAGAIYLSQDDGQHWQKLNGPAQSDALQFRDNQWLDSGRLVVMSAGEEADSGIFISDNLGQSWRRVATGETASTFYDCFYVASNGQGWLYGDADEKGLFVLATEDSGEHWQRQQVPFNAQPSEGGFASSGTCLNGAGDNGMVIGTGNGSVARVLLYTQGQWQSIESPIAGGEAGGIFSLQPIKQTLLVSGGSLKQSTLPAKAWLYDMADNSWLALPALPLTGAVYGSAVLSVQGGVEYWVSNPQGVAVLRPGASDWQWVSQSNIWSLACQAGKGCIGVGKNGRIELYQ
ncbi:hypothetical protein [Alteromonas lipolytica]|uniref:Photosynthesis system II assembly factor Ycf48/Hcf136-like domain-containing protein n=1 Tax=Alteromonas lipolytica TaxID=1856405 RepID=A0A1E8FG71_9ALTE|nr:hypothetical protein [Alteromonas lipolytica]OFI34942.1 hypothetical protein BFC17_15365 [Alteromonas lipolytica]